jgi:hypothetical protein
MESSHAGATMETEMPGPTALETLSWISAAQTAIREETNDALIDLLIETKLLSREKAADMYDRLGARLRALRDEPPSSERQDWIRSELDGEIRRVDERSHALRASMPSAVHKR